MEHSVVDIKGLRKSFGSHLVLKDIDFSVSPSQVVVIIGPSGSGKSTLLRCLNGLETAEGGTVVVGGHTVVEGGRMMPEAMLDALRAEVGMVFQSFNLFPHLNVLDNITLAPTCLRGVPRKTAQEQGLRLLRKVGLEHKARDFAFSLVKLVLLCFSPRVKTCIAFFMSFTGTHNTPETKTPEPGFSLILISSFPGSSRSCNISR